MRIIFLALLLLNLGLLGWHWWIEPAPQQIEVVPDATSATHAPAASNAQTSAPESDPVCVEWGPYPDKGSAAVAGIVLDQRNMTHRIIARETLVVESYHVYFPPYPTRAAAGEMAERLHQAGIQDVYIVPDGAERNAVSVGVFTDRAGAERRQQRLQSLGFKPELTIYKKHKEKRYWIRAKDKGAAALLRQIVANGEGKTHVVGCMRVAASATNP